MEGIHMIKAKDIMTTTVITLSPDMEILKAVQTLLDHNVNGAPVVDTEGNLVGILCQSDLVAQQKSIPIPSLFTLLDGFMPLTSMKRLDKEVEKIAALTVAHAMTPDPVSVTEETAIERIAELMVDKRYHTLPVVSDGKLVGVIGKSDILKTLLPKGTLSSNP
jgi:CBS domain-containing protein